LTHKHLNRKHTNDYFVFGGGQRRRRVARMLGTVEGRRRRGWGRAEAERPRVLALSRT
jgi:hypothetical protein